MFPGTLHPSVTVVFRNLHETISGAPVTISRSRAFTPVNGFSAGEIVQLVLAFVAAVTTGLQTFYFKAGGFGSFPDYLTLFAWGATIDQFKNFLQKLPPATQSIQGAAASAATPQSTAQTAAATSAGQQSAPATTAAAASSSSQASPSQSTPAAQAASSSQQATTSQAAAPSPPEIPDPPRRTSLPLEGEGT